MDVAVAMLKVIHCRVQIAKPRTVKGWNGSVQNLNMY